jgi:hypothetical protein
MVTLRNACAILLSSVGMIAVVGCGGRHDAIPESARVVAEDQGQSDFVAPSDGEVFVEDRSSSKLLYSGKIDSFVYQVFVVAAFDEFFVSRPNLNRNVLWYLKTLVRIDLDSL